MFQNNVNFDLISQFISHKHVTNAFMPDDQQSVSGMNCKFNKTLENLNQSISLEKIQETESKDYARESKGCDVFQDSLVADRNTIDKSDTCAISDSCSSFSSHSGRLELLKKVTNLEGKELSLPSERVRGAEFIRNKYFDSAKGFEKEHKKRKLMKKYAGGAKPIKIMDRSMQTSSSDADSATSPTSNQKNEVSKPASKVEFALLTEECCRGYQMLGRGLHPEFCGQKRFNVGITLYLSYLRLLLLLMK